MKKILLNGVDGNFGGKSAGILLEKYPHEDLIFTAPREKALKKYKEMGIETRVADFNNAETLVETFKGADTVVLISMPFVGPKRRAAHKTAIDAAVRAGVKKLVYTSFGNMFGAVIGPVLYRKLKKFSRLIFLFGGISIIGCIGGWMLHEQILMIIIYFITGIAIGGAMPIYFTMPIRLREISSDNISTAGGLITTFQLGGAVIVPSYIIAPIAGNNYPEIFILTAVVIAIAVGLGVLLEKELVKL